MVSCKQCSTPNSLDSTFCKRCGTALPEEDVQAAQEKLTALIAEGNTAFNEGRTDEAMAVAESACMSNPSSIPALSLKALCHERRGELAEALECADQIVDLNPDSELDRIKRNQLRTKLSVSVQLATQPPDRRAALIGAVAAVVLMLCAGIGVAKIVNQTETPKTNVALTPREQAPYAGNPNQIPPQNTNPAPQNSQPIQQSAPSQQPSDPGPSQPNLRYSQLGNDGLLPRTTDADGTDPLISIEGANSPLRAAAASTPTAPSVKMPTPITNTERPSTGDDPAPRPDDQRGAATQDQGPGIVDIQISSGPRKTFGGSVDSVVAGGATAMEKIGIQRFELGSYGSAASSFEQALRAGGDAVSDNKWLARCYERLGRKSDEIDAYKRCVSACQATIAKGTGNKDRIHTILDTCQQELKVLQGN